MAEQLGRGLQNLVDRCDSGSRLANLLDGFLWQRLEAGILFVASSYASSKEARFFPLPKLHGFKRNLFGFGGKKRSLFLPAVTQ